MRELTAAAEAGAASARTEQLRQAKELYVGNLPPGTAIYGLIDRLNDVLVEMGATTMPGKPIVSGWLGGEGQFAFLQVRTVEECNNALSLNGYNMDGFQLKVGRPKGTAGAITYSSPVPNVHGSATQFSLDELAGLGLVVLPPLDESTKIERLVLVGAPLHADKTILERILTSEGGDLERCDEVVDSRTKTKSLLFEFADVKSQRQIATKYLAFDRDFPLAVVRMEEAVRAGFINMQDEQFTSWTTRAKPSRIVWICNFMSVPPGLEADLVREIREICGNFGKIESSQLVTINRENISVPIFTTEKDVPVVIIEFETVQEAVKCRRYIRGASTYFMEETVFNEKAFTSFKPFEEILPECTSVIEDELLIQTPSVRNGKIVSVEQSIIDANKARKKLKLAPEEQEIID